MQMQTRKGQQGFTIIELVVVILLLGILAATALPRFIDVTEQAHDAVFSGVSGSFVTGTALYRAEWVARGQSTANTPIASYSGLLTAPGLATAGKYTEADTDDPSSYAAPAFANTSPSSGYPYGFTVRSAVGDFDAQNCAEIFEGLLQTGAPTTYAADTALGTVAAPVASETAIETAVNNAQTANPADFQVFVHEINHDTGYRAKAAGGADVADSSGEAYNHQYSANACVYAYSAEPGSYNRFLLYSPWNGKTETYTTVAELRSSLTAVDGPTVP